MPCLTMDMREKILDVRLSAVASFIQHGENVLDVGSDHAYLPLYLLRNGLCNKALATDIKQGPVDSALRNAIKYGLEDKVGIMLYDGIPPMAIGEYSTVVIAGMGGLTICNILAKVIDDLRKTSTKLVLQPMTEQAALREFLLNNGYIIKAEKYPFDSKKRYNVIYAICGEEKEKYSLAELHLGRISATLDIDGYYSYANEKIALTETAVVKGGDDKKNLLEELKNHVRKAR